MKLFLIFEQSYEICSHSQFAFDSYSSFESLEYFSSQRKSDSKSRSISVIADSVKSIKDKRNVFCIYPNSFILKRYFYIFLLYFSRNKKHSSFSLSILNSIFEKDRKKLKQESSLRKDIHIFRKSILEMYIFFLHERKKLLFESLKKRKEIYFFFLYCTFRFYFCERK